MLDSRLIGAAIAEIEDNPEQTRAIQEKRHCIVLAGPGSGKTKTLTVAMARTLLEDVFPPRGIACVTFNNECAMELQGRLGKLGIESSETVFIGTVHSFALAHVIVPYARCVPLGLQPGFRLATIPECNAAAQRAYERVFGDGGNALDRWKFAREKRKRDVDRTALSWRGRNPELVDFILAYESELRRENLIDFDDMPLLAFRMIQEFPWIRDSLAAKFPVLFVDEYQDLGFALHELVKQLCFGGGMRLFAVGDVDQSIYGFAGADPSLLQSLEGIPDVTSIHLRINYRFGQKLINASMGALGEDRDYEAHGNTTEGSVHFRAVDGDLDAQASFIMGTIVPEVLAAGISMEQVAILYRSANDGTRLANAADVAKIPVIRADNKALIPRNKRLARFCEACAQWVCDGWKTAEPSFARLAWDAVSMIYGNDATEDERTAVEAELISFLTSSVKEPCETNEWLKKFNGELIAPWQLRVRGTAEEWDVVDTMIARTDPQSGSDMPLAYLAGKVEGTGCLNLSTLHSAKGREFDAVILYGVNNDAFPAWRDKGKELREARRLFYVGVTRTRKDLYLVYQKKAYSPWVKELYDRVKS